MPKVRIRLKPKPGQTPQENTLGENIRGTDKKFKKGGKTTRSDGDQGYPFQRDQGYMYDDYARDMGGVITKMHVPDMDGNMYDAGGAINGVKVYDQDSFFKKGGNWLKGAVNPKHKGYCSPMTKSTCTGRRRAFAETMKKHHGFHKKDRGGVIYPFGRSDGDEKSVFDEYDRGGVIYPFGRSDGPEKSVFDEYDRGGVIYPFGRYDGQERSIWDNEYLTKLKNGGVYDQNLIGVNNSHDYYPKSDYNQYKKGGKKKDRGGVIYPFGRYDGDEKSIWDNEYFKQGGKYIGAGPNTDLNPTTNSTIADYNPYVYFKNKNWYITSNPEDDKITGSVKPVDEDVANIEAEKGEYMTKPGLTGLYKVTGKTHAEGGTPLYAEGGSFIFSNDPKLAFNKNEREAFGFKGGSSSSKTKNTPAMVLGREVDPKEYNGFIATLESPDTDKIAKTTAGLMLEKLQQKLGQVAYLQEAKKGTKPPDFSQGTAPVTQPEFQNIDEKMSEYAYGGPVDPRTGLPIDPSDQYPGGKTTLGRMTPTGLANSFNYPGGVPKLLQDWKGVGIDMTNMNSKEAQDAMYGWAQKNNPNLIKQMWGQYGDTAQGIKQGMGKYNFNSMAAEDIDQTKGAYSDGMLGARTFAPNVPNQQIPVQRVEIPQNPVNIQAPPPQTPPGINTNVPNPTLPYQIKGKLTDAQIANLGYMGLQAFNVNRYYPTRQQVSLPQVRLDKVNAQPYLNQINQQAHESYELAGLNPRNSSLIASNIRGDALDKSNQAIGNVANQNVQIGNQQNLTNLQQMTQQVMANSQFNNQYYNQVQETNQNFDNERRFANNQFVSTLNNYQSQADKTAWQLASVNRYGTRQVTDPKTGRTYNLPTPLYELNRNGIQFNADVANINMASGANRINTPQELLQTYNTLSQGQGMTPQLAERLLSSIVRARGNSQTGQGSFYTQNPYGPY